MITRVPIITIQNLCPITIVLSNNIYYNLIMLLYRVSKTLRTRILVIRDKLNRDKVSSKMPKMLPAHEELCRSNFALVCGRLFSQIQIDFSFEHKLSAWYIITGRNIHQSLIIQMPSVEKNRSFNSHRFILC